MLVRVACLLQLSLNHPFLCRYDGPSLSSHVLHVQSFVMLEVVIAFDIILLTFTGCTSSNGNSKLNLLRYKESLELQLQPSTVPFCYFQIATGKQEVVFPFSDHYH